MRLWNAIVLTVMLACSAAGARAGSSQVVVELFTSQGCASCPPADALFDGLADRPDVIALSFHVDYWDYLGWKDSFGNPAFTERQHAYARAWGRRMVYTPQLVIGGLPDGSGQATDRSAAEKHVAQAQSSATVDMEITAQDRGLIANVAAPRNSVAPCTLFLMTYLPSATVKIKRGENAGRSVEYRNVVRGWRKLGDWDGKTAATFDIGKPPDEDAVLVLQETGMGPIRAALRLPR